MDYYLSEKGDKKKNGITNKRTNVKGLKNGSHIHRFIVDNYPLAYHYWHGPFFCISFGWILMDDVDDCLKCCKKVAHDQNRPSSAYLRSDWFFFHRDRCQCFFFSKLPNTNRPRHLRCNFIDELKMQHCNGHTISSLKQIKPRFFFHHCNCNWG